MEQIKVGLLAVIAVTLVINTFFMDSSTPKRTALSGDAPSSSAVASTPGLPPAQQLNASNTNDPFAAQTTPAFTPEPAVPAGPLTSMNFKEERHSFGNVLQDTENQHIFKFTNTGEEPLIITDAKGSCGCTVPEYPSEPIAPGKQGEIKVMYKPGKQKGQQQKNVTITANTEPRQTVIYIEAEVEEIVAK